MQENKLEEVMVGIEPTGHYWFDLVQFHGGKGYKVCNGKSTPCA